MKKHHGKGGGKQKAKHRKRAKGAAAGPLALAASSAHRRAPGSTLIRTATARHWSIDARSLWQRSPRQADRQAPRARALSFAEIADDDRFALGVLLAPFLIIALSLGAERGVRHLARQMPSLIIAAQPSAETAVPNAMPPVAVDLSRAQPSPPSERVAALDTAVPKPVVVEPPAPPLPSLALLIEPPAPPLPSLALLIEPPAPPLPSLALLIEPPAPPLPSLALLIEPPAPPLPSLALLIEPPAPPLPSLALLIEPPAPPLPGLAAIDRSEPPICLAKPARPAIAASPPHGTPGSGQPEEFGLALATAARRQLDEFVIYNARYQRISYPMGDVSPMFGVCTDVVVRAYRELGIDLQALIYKTRSGTGDRNIDHRRVTVMSRFLSRHGEKLPISDMPEDYQPGDIVTYYRPQNRSSTTHIAIVSDVVAPSGRLMIVHNRGWGPQLEDALFVDKITGHFRFRGLATGSIRQAATATSAAVQN